MLHTLCAVLLSAGAHAQSMPLAPPGIREKQRPRIEPPEFIPAPLEIQSGKDAAALPPLCWIGAEGKPLVLNASAPPPWDQALVMIVDPAVPAHIDSQSGTLELADGQRIRGAFAEGPDGPMWTSSWQPPRTLTRSGLRSIIASGDTAPPAGESDIVVLASGDRVEGRVVAMRSSDVQLEEGSNSVTSIAWDRIRSISFTGAEATPAGARVWLADGSVIDGETLAWSGTDELQVGTTVRVPRNAVLGVRRAANVCTPLSALKPTVSEAADGLGLRYRLVDPSVAGGRWGNDAAPIEVDGPLKLSYPAQPVAAVLSMSAALRPSVRSIGVVEVVVRAGGRELHRARLHSATPRTSISAAVGTAPFEIEILAADGSSVGDVVVLERALLLKNNPR